MILAYHKLDDDCLDAGKGKVKSLLARQSLLSAYKKASSFRPDYDLLCKQKLDELRALERAHCRSFDRVADTFGSMMEFAAEDVEDPVQKRVLRQILYHMGRWVYLIDAADDLH